MKYILSLVVLLLSSTTLWCFPTIEGLLRNNANAEHEIKSFLVSFSSGEPNAIAQSIDVLVTDPSEGEQPSFLLRRVNQDGQEFFNVSPAISADTSSKVQVEAILLSLIHSQLFNKESIALKNLRKFCGVISPQSTEINHEKKAILDELRSMVRKNKLKEEQIWKTLNNGHILATQKILNEPYYLTDQKIEIVAENNDFFYEAKMSQCQLRFGSSNFDLRRFRYNSSTLNGDVEFLEPINFNGVYYFPSMLVFKGNSTESYRITAIRPVSELPTWAKQANTSSEPGQTFFIK